jgi:mono/diheme cytochrome c family protein
VAVALTAAGAAAQSPSERVFTQAQADAGRAAYADRCAVCHRADLGGREDAPQLAGSDFINGWRSRPIGELFDYVNGMPPDGARLTPEQYLSLVAYLLEQNGATAGDRALTPSTATSVGSVATGRKPATSGARDEADRP